MTITVWLVEAADGLTLVDAGMSFMAKPIIRHIRSLEKPLRQIVLTHGHPDHVGSLAKLRETFPDVPVYAHETEIPYMEGQWAYPKRKKPKRFVAPGTAVKLPADKRGNLLPIGGLQPYLTPGHSPGHVVYMHEQDRVMLAGDLFTTKGGQWLRPPMFTPDMPQAIASGAIVLKVEPHLLAVCHSREILRPHVQYEEYRRRFSAKYAPANG